MTKLLTVEMEQLRKIIDHPELFLTGPEERLSSLLREGRAEQIKGALVIETVDSLSKDCQTESFRAQREIVIKLFDKKKEELQQILRDLRDCWKWPVLEQKPSLKLRFVKEICQKDVEIIAENKVKSKPAGGWKLALL